MKFQWNILVKPWWFYLLFYQHKSPSLHSGVFTFTKPQAGSDLQLSTLAKLFQLAVGYRWNTISWKDRWRISHSQVRWRGLVRDHEINQDSWELRYLLSRWYDRFCFFTTRRWTNRTWKWWWFGSDDFPKIQGYPYSQKTISLTFRGVARKSYTMVKLATVFLDHFFFTWKRLVVIPPTFFPVERKIQRIKDLAGWLFFFGDFDTSWFRDEDHKNR